VVPAPTGQGLGANSDFKLPLYFFPDFSPILPLRSHFEGARNMKKITLLVPDKINCSRPPNSAGPSLSAKPLTAELLKLALTENDYHLNYFFANPEDVKILSLEDAD
jgi:hypothetical protein